MTPMTHSGAAQVTLPTDEQILITREFDAPKHLVYKAYTTAELIRRWWAGKRGNVTVAEVDLRVGGRYRYALVTDEGMEVAFNGEFREIVENERLVNTEIYEGAPPSDDDPVLNVVTFTALDGDRTLVEMLMQCPNKTVRDIIIDSGMESGLQESLDALDDVAVSLR
jgi:uncharacterized protein YndB with AHSA1/START domain